jgi:hypothetical protein
MSDLFKTYVNGTEQEQEDRKYWTERKRQRQTERDEKREQERLNQFPELVHQIREREKAEKLLRERLERRKANSLPERAKRIYKYLFDL